MKLIWILLILSLAGCLKKKEEFVLIETYKVGENMPDSCKVYIAPGDTLTGQALIDSINVVKQRCYK